MSEDNNNLEDEQAPDGRSADSSEVDSPRNAQAPVPPLSYDPQFAHPTGGDFHQAPSRFDSARKLTLAAQIMAVVSLLFGGVILSAAAIVVSIIGYRKASSGAQAQGNSTSNGEAWQALKRTAIMAIVMSVAAFAANAIALAMIMPTVNEYLQSGENLVSLWGETESNPGSSSSFWG